MSCRIILGMCVWILYGYSIYTHAFYTLYASRYIPWYATDSLYAIPHRLKASKNHALHGALVIELLHLWILGTLDPNSHKSQLERKQSIELRIYQVRWVYNFALSHIGREAWCKLGATYSVWAVWQIIFENEVVLYSCIAQYEMAQPSSPQRTAVCSHPSVCSLCTQQGLMQVWSDLQYFIRPTFWPVRRECIQVLSTWFKDREPVCQMYDHGYSAELTSRVEKFSCVERAGWSQIGT